MCGHMCLIRRLLTLALAFLVPAAAAGNLSNYSVVVGNFSDADPDALQIAGNVSWDVLGLEQNDSGVGVNIYVANDPVGSERSLLGSATATDTSFSVAADTALPSATSYLLFYVASAMEEQEIPTSLEVSDLNGSVESLTFYGEDLNLENLTGNLTFIAPVDEQISHYAAYLATSAFGEGRWQVGSVSGGDRLSVQLDVARASFTHFVVYATSADGIEQSTPVALSLTDVAASFMASDLAFADEDLDVAELGGTVSWTPAQVDFTITEYRLYLAQETGTPRSLLSSAASGSAQVPANTALGVYTHWMVHSANENGEQDTPHTLAVNDTDGSVTSPYFFDLDPDDGDIAGPISWTPPLDLSQVSAYHLYLNDGIAAVKVAELSVGSNSYTLPVSTNASYTEILIYSQSSSSLQSSPVALSLPDLDFSPQSPLFIDQRLDAGELGGVIQWTAPANDSEVVQYNVYLAADATGTGRSFVGSTYPGNHSFTYVDSALQLYSYVLVYTESSMGEQDMPSATGISDTSASVSNVGFVDNDVDALEIAGSVTWTPPSDTSQVTGYRTYLCSGSLCSTRAQLGSHVAVGTNQVSFSTVTIAQSQTHIGVYAKSSLEEQSTPATIVLVDEQISAGNISFSDVDVDAGQVAGNITWDQATLAQVSGYALYLGDAVSKFIKLADLSGVSNTEYDIPLDTETNGSTHLLVCLVSAGVEQSSCDPYLFYDVTESVSDVAFTGQDLDLNELGGIITWSPPAWVVYTQRYLVYLAEDAVGTARSQVETAVPVGTNELQLSANTPRLNFTHFLVYTETSWQEQSTPASLAFQDAVAVAGEPNQANVPGLIECTMLCPLCPLHD
ncbi:unnamed protein product [Durusdinium trenchii]|uniref:Fibronectin type-III domain-containing protein n=1 Tax=Durusdinium trenchii TaxID=1381693 RepID=A0ABP0SR95_9DINO